MKIYRYESGAGPTLAYELDGRLVNGQRLLRNRLIRKGIAPDSALRIASGLLPADIGDLLGVANGDPVAYLASLNLASIDSGEDFSDDVVLDEAKLTLLPPLARDGVVYAVGRNYAEHVREAGREIPDIPAVFIRTPDSLVGGGQSLLRPSVSEDFDFEGELAIHIGAPFRLVTPEQSLQYVAGYSVFNDGSIRDYQSKAPILIAGKNFYHSGSCGPNITTADEVGDAQNLDLATYVNGELMQKASTADMIFNIGQILSYISEFTVLRPGDIVATGTPAGVGAKRKPPRWLKDGDELKIEISSVGVLTNRVRDHVIDR
jgi:2-keto-4-pentenoate hydratase/2-oxohepta-3-ene-1,7-dioic acid hydratase in catechol pathway